MASTSSWGSCDYNDVEQSIYIKLSDTPRPLTMIQDLNLSENGKFKENNNAIFCDLSSFSLKKNNNTCAWFFFKKSISTING